MSDSFEIYLGKYKAVVENKYQSQQISRFKITLQGKYFVLEQHHLKKPFKWKLKEYSDDVNINKVIGLLDKITSQIEAYYTHESEFPYRKKSW